MAEPVNVVKISEAAAIDQTGRLSPVMRVQYMVGTHGPFFRDFPKEGFDPMAIMRQLEEFARQLATLTSPR